MQPPNAVYGYIRVSSKDQNEARQVDAMKTYGVMKDYIYVDRQSGINFERPAWKRLNAQLRSGDIVIVHSIDRLGRNYKDILEQWRILTKERGVRIVVLTMPILNDIHIKDVTGQLISDIVLLLLSYVAETERTFIRERQREGITAARLRGVKFGAPVKRPPREFDDVYRAWESGRISARAAAKCLSVSRGTFKKWTRRYCDN